MDFYHHKSRSTKIKEKISREESAKRGQKSHSKFLVLGRESPINTDDVVMVSLESDATDADVDNTYISLNSHKFMEVVKWACPYLSPGSGP